MRKKLKKRIDNLEEQMKLAHTRLGELECNHDDQMWDIKCSPWKEGHCWIKCDTCGKKLSYHPMNQYRGVKVEVLEHNIEVKKCDLAKLKRQLED